MNQDLAKYVDDYDNLVKVEVLLHIARSRPDLMPQAIDLAIDYGINFNYGAKYLRFYSENSTSSKLEELEKKFDSLDANISDLDSEYDALADKLADEEDDRLPQLIADLRATSLAISGLHLSNNNHNGALESIAIYYGGYSAGEFTKQDYERQCFVAIISKRFELVVAFKAKLDEYAIRASDEENISYWKIRWMILVGLFRAKRYDTLIEEFELLAASQEGKMVLEQEFHKDSENSYNCLVSRDIILIYLLSLITVSTSTAIRKKLDQNVLEPFFAQYFEVYEFIQALISKNFKELARLKAYLEKDLIPFIYVIEASDWDYLMKVLRAKLYLFYFSLVDKVLAKDVASRLVIEKSQVVLEVTALSKVLGVNILFTPQLGIFERKLVIVGSNIKDWTTTIVSELEGIILQTKILNSLNTMS